MPYRLLYSFLLTLSMPFVLLRLLWRSRRAPAYRQRMSERFALRLPRQQAKVWIHAVSVGEVQAALPIIKHLLATRPDQRILVTTITPTGAAHLAHLCADDRVLHHYLPYDLAWMMRRFSKAVRPQLLIVMETEIWPNMLHVCRQHGISSMLANARLSERSARGYARVARLTRTTLAQLDIIAVQTAIERDRFLSLGATAEQLVVTGSVKFDIELDDAKRVTIEQYRQGWQGRPVWVAASLHEGEDKTVLLAHQQILKTLPNALLVMAPRHPERFDRAAEMIQAQGLTCVRRSETKPLDDAQVLLLDTLGELALFLAAADCAFIGGSLAAVGGHNPLEASVAGVPVALGPYHFNFDRISNLLLDAGAAVEVTDATSLANAMLGWLANPTQRIAAGKQALAVMAENRGATEKLFGLVDSLL